MSFDWSKMQASLVDVFAQATGIPFVWDDAIRNLPRPPIGVLSLGQSMTVGRDAHRYEFRDSNMSLDLYGHREVVINIQIRARQQKGAPSSRMLAEKARLMLANPCHRDELRKAGLVFVETNPLLTLDVSRTNRKELRSTFDVVFRLVMHEEIVANTTGYFESVIMSEKIL